MSDVIMVVVQYILLILAIATIGAFWFEMFATIFNRTFVEKPTDNEIEDKTK